ncbi:MAG: hypothetical protein EXS10_09475 [Phycisphaerales bacterium]|nr:hypothetical protein [Phycisphaerales bacterium]
MDGRPTTSSVTPLARRRSLVIATLAVGCAALTSTQFSSAGTPIGRSVKVDPCSLKGRVQVVKAFGDYKVEIVTAFADLKVMRVSALPSRAGEWQFVDALGDFSVEFVDAFGDFKIEYVTAFPGCK